MQHVIFTRVDAINPNIVAPAPLPGGPADPAGCVFGFALESQYPTDKPIFYGATTGSTELPGILAVIDQEAYDAAEDAEMIARLPSPPTTDDVTEERDRRIDAGLEFGGKRFQSRAGDRENIAGAAQLASWAIDAGAQPGNLRWADPGTDFVWIAEDNSLVPMDAPTVIMFAKAAAARKQALTLIARGIKDIAPIPADFRDDAYWSA